MNDCPALSVVVAGYDLGETSAVRSLIRAQTIAPRLELVLVLPRSFGEAPPDLFNGLWGGHVLRLDFRSRGDANAAGVRAAHAPIVVLGEDHCYPETDWAEALLADHQGPWSVVGPQVRNANPDSRISQADFVIGYGLWARIEDAGEMSFLPGHNSSYKRAVLLEYEEDLEQALCSETVLHWDLARRGHRLLLSQRAVVHHLNFSEPAAFRRAQLLNGRLFAAVRAARWGLLGRFVYFAGSPLIPWVRAWRLRTCFGTRASRPAKWRALPVLLGALHIDAAGQALGYAFGAGRAEEELADFEFGRLRFVLPTEREAIEVQAEFGR